MAGYEQVHAGDIVLGYDGDLWGVESIDRSTPQITVTLVKHERRITGYPPAGTQVTVVHQADVTQEASAAGVLINAGFGVEILGERWDG